MILRGFHVAMFILPATVFAQAKAPDSSANVSLTVRVTHGADPVPAALVRAGRAASITGIDGAAVLRIPMGDIRIVVTRLGFSADTVQVALSSLHDTTIAVDLTPAAAGLTPVVVAASRIERRVQDEPERVEVLSGEDVGEKAIMRPASPTTLLSEMPGVRVQTTSPGLGGAGVRLQGLRGRYTLLLADGLPLYGSASEGLGFLQIPPLDLAQAEVIKGAATALYGPAAAGGVLNLISRRPPRSGRADREILLNQTSRKGSDGLIWLADSISRTSGYTFIGGAHNQLAIDVNGDNWADIPAFRRIELRPRIFLRSESGSSAMFTVGAAGERRHSGFLSASSLNGVVPYRVAANTYRGDAGLVAHIVNRRGDVFSIRSSVNQQWQDRQYGDSTESDRRGTAFAEGTLARSFARHQALVGAAIQQDGLSSARLAQTRYRFFTSSLFAQETFTPIERLSVSGTARLDHHDRYGTFLSPRISTLFHVGDGWAARASAGQGVFAPTPLVEEAEAVGLARVRGFNGLRAESVRQASADLTRTQGAFEVTGTVYRSELSHAVVVHENFLTGTIDLLNAPVPTRTAGASVYLLYNGEPVAITALYGYTRSREWSPDESRVVEAALTPRHSAGLDFAVTLDETGTRAGLEVFYTGRQSLEDNPYRKLSVPYTTVGILLEQKIGRASIFLNGENLTGVRQTRFDALLQLRQTSTGEWTTPQWAPLEGRIFNAGFRLSY
jgi:outer membrane receptor for ferrienterochelin and colicins